MAGASRISKLVKNEICSGRKDVDLRLIFYDFSHASSFELGTVDRSVFYHLSPGPDPPAHQSLSPNLRRHPSPSRHPARGCVSSFFLPA